MLQIIDYFNPRFWFLESPQTGLLKLRPFMLELPLPYTDVDYCRYSDWGYKKRTRIWNNSGFQGKLCLGFGKCPHMEGRRHTKTAQQGDRFFEGVRDKQRHSQSTLNKIPPELCASVAMHVGVGIADSGVR